MKKIVSLLSAIWFAGSMCGQTTMLINPNGDGGFENGTTFAANGWTSVNYASTSNNNWCLTSSAKANGSYGFTPTGTRAALISDNNGTNWTYTTAGAQGATHLYRNVTFPAGETNIQLSFRWNAAGEAQYDELYVYLAPTSRTPVTGIPNGNTSAVTGWTGTGTSTLVGVYSLLPASLGTTATVSLPASLAGTTQRLVFTWKNDGSGGTRPPAALDDISLKSSSCGLTPTALNSTTLTATSANYTWTPGGSETAWDIYYGPQPIAAPTATTVPTATTSAASYSVTGLNQTKGYDIYVRANCSGGVFSPWTAVKSFTTLASCPAPGGLTLSAITPTTAVATWTASGPATTWFVKYSAPTNTVSVSGTPSYTLTGLTSNTNYTVQVRGYCGIGDSSLWTPQIVFTTQCFVAVPSTSNSTQCGLGIPTASVSGGTFYKWYASPTSLTAVQEGSSDTYTNQINATTTWYVSSVNGSCESTRSAVTASVTPTDGVSATASSSAICPGSAITLHAIQSGSTNVYSYTWTATPAADSGIPTSATGASLSVLPTAPGTYNYNVIASDGICTAASSVSILVNNAPTINAGATPTVLCSGSTGNLYATNHGMATIGTATTTTAPTLQQPTAFCNRYSSYRMQAVYTAAELNAAGLRAGNITSIAFNVTALGSAATNPLYTVRCGTTTLTAFTGFVSNAGFTTTHPPATYTHSVGVNVIPFSTPYYWDGVSNLIVELMHNGAFSINNAPTYYTATAGNTVVFSFGTLAFVTNTMRLNITFGGQVLSQNGGGLSWQWNPGAINSNTASISPVNTGTAPATQVYTVTANDPVTTCSNTVAVGVLVNPTNSPSTSNSTQCGSGIPTASVSGGTFYNWYASPTSATVVQAGSNATYTNQINATTTWYVSTVSGSCESTRSAVTASVTPTDALSATASSSTVCFGSALTLSAVQNGSTNVYSYTWTATPAADSGIPTSATGASLSVSPTAPGTYIYALTASDGICNAASSVSIVVNNAPVVNASATSTVLCSGSTGSLEATTNVISAGHATIGTATTTTLPVSQNPTAFCNRYSSYRMQLVYTAAELNAAGLRAGNITSIAFHITALGSAATNPLFTVKCGTTTVSAFTNFLYVSNTGFTTVYPPATYTHSVGLNVIPFSTPYNWDGVSNLVVEITHDGAGSSDNAPTYYTATTGNTVIYNFGASPNIMNTMRLNIIFGGQAVVQTTGGLSWQWNPGAINSNTANISPVNTGTVAATQVYTVTATDPATTCSGTATVGILVEPFPATPVATNSSQCGLGIPTASVSGGTAYKWYATPTSTTVLQAGTSATYTDQINATTSWYVSSYNSTCSGSARAMLAASVSVPESVTAAATSTAICSGETFTLTSTQSGTANAYTYTWAASPAAGSGIPTSAPGTSLSVSPTAPGTYTYVLTASDGVCTAASSVSILVNNIPVVNASATPTVLCSGSTANLIATTNGVSSGNVTLGTGTSVTTGTVAQPTAFCNQYSSYRMQIVYTAAELNAAGLRAGNITSIAFKVTALGWAATNPLYTVRCGTTAVSTFTDFISNAGFTTVYPPATYTHSVGVNVIPFSTPYNWDGISNLVVELTHNGANGLTDAPTYYTATSGNMVAFTNNGNPAFLSTMRLNIVFGGQAAAQTSGGLSWQWNPGAINSNTASISPVNTGAVAATQVYTVTATDPATSCSNTATVSVVVNPLPAAPTGVSSIQCRTAVPTASVAGSGGTYKWYGSPAGTTALQSSANATYATAVSTSTTFYVSEFDGNCEGPRAAVSVTVNTPDAVTATSSSTVVCPGQSFTLTAANTGTNNAYSYTWTATPAAGSGMATSVTGATASAMPVTPGSRNYKVTAADAMCTTTAVVTVLAADIPSIATQVNPGVACVGFPSTLNATSASSGLNWQWNPGAVNSNSTTVTPSAPGALSYTVTAINPATTCSNTAVVNLTANASPSVSVAASTGSVCSGTTASLTANGASTYNWMPAGGTSSVAVVSPASTTVYTVTGTSLGCSDTKTVNLNVTPTPTVAASASPGVICAGATVSLTASGAATYSWMPNGSTSGTSTATPAASTIYTVTGTTAGCTNTRTLNVTVNNVPALTVTSNPPALCTTGATATLSATGTSTSYAWSTGANTATTSVAPSATTVYTVIGTNSCGATTVTTSLVVAKTPTIAATSSGTICPNNPAVLTASATPGVVFSWNTGAGTASISVTPATTTTYTVTGTNICGTATATVVQTVDLCIGIEEMVQAGDIIIYPNPANDYVNIAVPANLASTSTSVEVTDALGKLVIKQNINTDVTTLEINKLEDGIYFFKVISNNQTVKVGKVVKH